MRAKKYPNIHDPDNITFIRSFSPIFTIMIIMGWNPISSSTNKISKDIAYARNYNPRFVYFLPTFWRSIYVFSRRFFLELCPGFWSRAGYSGGCTYGTSYSGALSSVLLTLICSILQQWTFQNICFIFWKLK